MMPLAIRRALDDAHVRIVATSPEGVTLTRWRWRPPRSRFRGWWVSESWRLYRVGRRWLLRRLGRSTKPLGPFSVTALVGVLKAWKVQKFP